MPEINLLEVGLTFIQAYKRVLGSAQSRYWSVSLRTSPFAIKELILSMVRSSVI